MKLKVLFRSNNYSPCWELSEMFNAEQTILNRIANPLESESKEYVPLWAFYSLSPFAFPVERMGDIDYTRAEERTWGDSRL